MATLAAYFKRPIAGAAGAADSQAWIEESDPYALRPLPCEDVYLYCKKINNSRVVKQSDPIDTRRAFRIAASFCLALVLMVGMLAPKALGLAAGYELEKLKAKHERLLEEKVSLDLEEARLLNPQRLAELAKTLQLEDPAPTQIHRLNPQPSNSFAWDLSSKKR